jgi:hypothetical protein
VTAYQLTPVGASGPEPERAVVLDIPTRAELWRQLQDLRDEVERVETVAANERQWKWQAQERAETTAEVLRQVSAVSPQSAAVVHAARERVRRRRRTDGRLDE